MPEENNGTQEEVQEEIQQGQEPVQDDDSQEEQQGGMPNDGLDVDIITKSWSEDRVKNDELTKENFDLKKRLSEAESVKINTEPSLPAEICFTWLPGNHLSPK